MVTFEDVLCVLCFKLCCVLLCVDVLSFVFKGLMLCILIYSLDTGDILRRMVRFVFRVVLCIADVLMC